MSIIKFLSDNQIVIVAALLACSEVLALVPSIKQNSIFEIVVGILNKFVPPKQ